MKKKGLLIFASLVLIVSLIFAFQHLTQAQAPGPGGAPGAGRGGTRGMGTMMMSMALPLENEWAQISFAMDVSDEALIKARAVFLETWNKRKEIIAKAGEMGDDQDARRALMTEITNLKTSLDTKLKDILTPEQLDQLAKWEKENQDRARTRPQQPGGGGPQGPQR